MPPGLQPIIPVILSGGTGTRLWPVSREAHPKPFMLMPDGQSLLQKTYLRAQQTSGADRSITVTNRDYFFSSRDTLQQSVSDTSGCVFLLEKNGRNTAAPTKKSNILSMPRAMTLRIGSFAGSRNTYVAGWPAKLSRIFAPFCAYTRTRASCSWPNW